MIQIWQHKLILSAAILCSAADRGVKECKAVRDRWKITPLGIVADTSTNYDPIAKDIAVAIVAVANSNPTAEESALANALIFLMDYEPSTRLAELKP